MPQRQFIGANVFLYYFIYIHSIQITFFFHALSFATKVYSLKSNKKIISRGSDAAIWNHIKKKSFLPVSWHCTVMFWRRA